jgi:electron transfer flavoprotein beta subunit
VKILVPVKRVSDPDNANKIKIPAGGAKIDTTGLEWKPNPFDEYAVEAALRLTENGATPKQRGGEAIVVTFGPADTVTTLRSALATGADRAIRVDSTDEQLDGVLVAKSLKALVEKEKPDLVLMGKQAVDGDSNQVGQMLAELLGWPMATFAATIKQEDGSLLVGREVDGGVLTLRVKLPAVVTVDLRIVAPTSVYSKQTAPTFKYNDGVRFAALPAIMSAKKKPLAEMKVTDLVPDTTLSVKYLSFEPPPARKAGVKVKSVTELVDKLVNEAKVL